MTVEFSLDGQPLRRPQRRPAVHVQRGDLLPDRLRGPGRGRPLLDPPADGGEEGPCGWLKDRFGVSWQVVPTRLFELLGDAGPGPRAARDPGDAGSMQKIDIAELERAADAVPA